MFNGIRNTEFWKWFCDIIETTTELIYFNTVSKKETIITVNTHHFWPYFTPLIIHWNTLLFITTKKCNRYNKCFFLNKFKHFILSQSFSLNTCKCLKYHQLQWQHKQHWNYRRILSSLLCTVKSSEMFPRHNGFATISDSFALNLIIPVRLTNK